MALRIVSADSHMIEPANLWVERIDHRFKERAPRAVTSPDKPGAFFHAEGLRPFSVAAVAATGRDGEEYAKHMGTGYEAVRPSGWDPVERLKDQDIDGVEAEVLYTSLGMPLFGLKDPDLQRACFHVYNDWLAEFCSHNPQRLLGVPLVSLDDVGLAVQELERCRKQNLKGAMIWGYAPEDRPYSSPEYDPFWQAASELEMPLSLHIVTGGVKSPAFQMAASLAKSEKYTPGIAAVSLYHFLMADIQATLYTLVVSGVLERFPKLMIVSAENDTGWLPHFMYPARPRLQEILGHFGDQEARDDAERLHPPPGVGYLPGRSDRTRDVEVLRREQLHVGIRLPAWGLHLAQFAQGD